jgi:PAS domain S-box-containing protein
MKNPDPQDRPWTERSIDPARPAADGPGSAFARWFGRSAKAVLLLDEPEGTILDCNRAAVELLRAPDRQTLLGRPVAAFAPAVPPEQAPSPSEPSLARFLRSVHQVGNGRIEGIGRRFDGSPVPLEVSFAVVEDPGEPRITAVCRDLTEQRRVEEEIRRLNATLEQRVAARTAELSASEARLRTLVEHAPEAIVVFDGETGGFELVNDNAVRLYGRSREELLRLRPGEVSPPFQPDGRPSAVAAHEYIREALAGGSPVFDWLHVRPNGRVFTSEVRLVRLPSEGRSLVRASIIDTTERRRREQTQRAVYEISEAVHTAADLPALYARIHGIVRGLMPAENFYIALFDAASGMISFPYYVDELATTVPEPRKISTGLTGLVLRTGRAVLADRQFTERSRREGNQVVAEALGHLRYVESGRPAAVWLGVPLTIQGKSIGVMAVQDYHDDQAYAEEQKQILGYVATQTAVAIERKRSEEALRELVEKHRALFEASSQGVMLHDDEKFLEVNPAAVRILGRRDASEVVGRHPAAFAPEIQPDGRRSDLLAREQIGACLEKGSVHFDWAAVRPDGQLIQMDVLLTRVQWGGRWLIQAMVEDITERKRAEAELLKALAREKELSQLKTSFVSTVSHEFRTPLGIIMSSSQILADYFDRLPPEERLEHLRSIAKNTRQMANLMEEVLVLSRVDSGRMDLDPLPLDLLDLCRRLVDEVLSATQRRAEIRLAVAPDARPARADEHLLRHVFVNLLSNAVKYSPSAGTIDFEIHRDGTQAVCVVRDRGIGIPEADREWLFAAFPPRAKRRRPPRERPRPHHRQTLRRTPPRAHRPPERSRKRHRSLRSTAPLPRPAGHGTEGIMKTILVIEDEPEMRRNLVTILQLEGFRPLAADNGRRGVELARTEAPDLVLCDVMMPQLDGYGVLAELHNDPSTMNIPFVFLTARGEKADVRGGMNLGADDYLTKPVDKNDLLKAINTRLARAEQLARREFQPNFDSPAPLAILGLTPRVAEVLLWVAQGKTNGDIATILGISESTVKKHLLEIFAQLGVETRSAATRRALEILSAPAVRKHDRGPA